MYLSVLITIQKADVDPGTLVFNFLMMDDGKYHGIKQDYQKQILNGKLFYWKVNDYAIKQNKEHTERGGYTLFLIITKYVKNSRI